MTGPILSPWSCVCFQGFVSLDCYDPQEYDPFLLSITRPLDCYKVRKHTNPTTTTCT